MPPRAGRAGAGIAAGGLLLTFLTAFQLGNSRRREFHRGCHGLVNLARDLGREMDALVVFHRRNDDVGIIIQQRNDLLR